MITRRTGFRRNFDVNNPTYQSAPGSIHVTMHKGIPQTWAISRPSTSYEGSQAPHYMEPGHRHKNVERAGVLKITPARPKLEMDPTNMETWQRPYRFT